LGNTSKKEGEKFGQKEMKITTNNPPSLTNNPQGLAHNHHKKTRGGQKNVGKQK